MNDPNHGLDASKGVQVPSRGCCLHAAVSGLSAIARPALGPSDISAKIATRSIVGWDVAITLYGPILLEGNTTWDMRIVPQLSDELPDRYEKYFGKK